jgi:hypothetical protein
VLVSCGANVSVVYRGQNILLSQNVTLASYSISRAWFQLNYSVNYTGSGNTTTSFWRVLDTSALLGNYSLRCWVNDTQNNRVYLDNSSFMVVSTTTTTTYSSASSTTSTTMQQCIMPGKYPPCAEVALSEVVAAINRWAAGEFALGDVINLINSWADPSAYPPN